MERAISLANRLEEVLLNGRWIANTNFKSQIENLSREQATHKIGTLNSIAALTFHVNYYLEGLTSVLNGGQLEIKDKYSFDLPPIESDSDWKKLVVKFISNSEAFIRGVQSLEDSMLDEVFFDEKYGSYQRNMEGVIEHSYYHLGQVSLIRKLLETTTPAI